MGIFYRDRKTGALQQERVYGEKALSFVYGRSLLSRISARLFLPWIAKCSFFSRLYGFLQKTNRSRKKIAPFIQAYQVDASEFATTEFASFNDFFIRKLRPESRPIPEDKNIACLPADGRYLVFPDLENVKHFYAKGQSFSLPKLLQDDALSRLYQTGSMVIARLCPSDYHRFHFPCQGIPQEARPIEGALFSVNPLALAKNLSFLWENKRMCTQIDTDLFGTLLFLEIGATFVGSIHQTYEPQRLAQKGDEKGFFSFGGSCLILLFEKGRITFSEDLVKNSLEGIETKGLFGEPLGVLQ